MASVFPNPALPEEREMSAIPTQGATGKYPLPFPSAMVWWQSLWRKYQRMGGGGIQQIWRQTFCLNFKIWFLLSFPSYPWSSIPAGGWFSHQNPCACKLSILSPSIWELSRKFPSRALYLNLGIGKSLCGHTHGFSLLQAPFPGLFGQILAADEKANGFWPVRGRLLPALVDGISDGKGHAKGKRFQIPQGETLKLRREKKPRKCYQSQTKSVSCYPSTILFGHVVVVPLLPTLVIQRTSFSARLETEVLDLKLHLEN